MRGREVLEGSGAILFGPGEVGLGGAYGGAHERGGRYGGAGGGILVPGSENRGRYGYHGWSCQIHGYGRDGGVRETTPGGVTQLAVRGVS